MQRLDRPIVWTVGTRELVLNGHRDRISGAINTDQAAYVVEAYDFSPLDIREQREGLHLLTGGDFGPATRQFRHISLRGHIRAGSGAELDDMEAAFLAAFDIERCQQDAPATFGVGTLKHWNETAFDGPGIGHLFHEGFYARPENYPITYDQRGPRGYTRPFIAQLAAAYPYRCVFPQESVIFSAAAGWTKYLPNWSRLVGGTSRLRLEIDMAGAGSASLTISDGTRSLVLDMSTALSTWVLVVEMWSKQLYLLDPGNINNMEIGEQKPELRDSDIDSFFDVPAGGCDVSISNTSNVTSVTATYHQTRA